MSTSITNVSANRDPFAALTSFLSTQEKVTLRATCRTLRSDIPDFPTEAKTFLAFEAKLPLIKEIVRMTPIYRESMLGIVPNQRGIVPPERFGPHQTWAQRRDTLHSAWKYVAAIGIPLLAAASLGKPIEEGVANQMSGGESIIFLTSLMVATYALPRLTEYLNGNIDRSVPLKQLWHELKNGEIPSDLLGSGERLTGELQSHQRLARAYQEAGGMDRYYARSGYTAGGLDQAFHEAIPALPREAMIAL
ncbi:MAG: hypothetical protein NTX49_07700 [Chlamydiae bacterium]|nr:hypothetical protein [Chlamydiota bacterium]